MLISFFDEHYLSLTADEQRLFNDLVSIEDSMAYELLLLNSEFSDNHKLSSILKKIKNTTHD